ncbi:hypothetical protein VTO42DRAFT_2904 [Malbranchea cinnamomea]
MGKRKQDKDADVEMGGTKPDADDSSESDLDMINVDFEWFDPQPAVDFHGLKVLLRQLFETDAQLFDLSALTDLILSQPLLGSTVKVDGNESDPYAFLTVLNLQEHKDVPVIKTLTEYILQKASSTSSLAPLKDLLSQQTVPAIGLILTERLINMPVEVIPPMYTMLQEEIAWALEDNEPYNFTHYLIISKVYEEVESKLDQEDDRPQKKKKKTAGDKPDIFYFHPEDELLHKHAMCHGNFLYTYQQAEGHSDSKRAFQEYGIKPHGHMILLDAKQFDAAAKDLKETFKPPS